MTSVVRLAAAPSPPSISCFHITTSRHCSCADILNTAFILYRQHNQAAVVAQNPRLANPEVSKIIGDHWRNLSADEKNHWKLLADVSIPVFYR